MALYVHPTTNIADAAVHAFDSGAHLESKAGKVVVVKGRRPWQYRKALAIQQLNQLARDVKGA